MSFVVQAFNDSRKTQKQTEQLFNYLNLKAKINRQTNVAMKQSAAKDILGVPPSQVPTTNNAENITNKFQLRDSVLLKLQELLDPSTASQMLQYLENTGDLEGFNIFFPKFKDEIKSLKGAKTPLVKSLWETFKRKVETQYSPILGAPPKPMLVNLAPEVKPVKVGEKDYSGLPPYVYRPALGEEEEDEKKEHYFNYEDMAKKAATARRDIAVRQLDENVASERMLDMKKLGRRKLMKIKPKSAAEKALELKNAPKLSEFQDQEVDDSYALDALERFAEARLAPSLPKDKDEKEELDEKESELERQARLDRALQEFQALMDDVAKHPNEMTADDVRWLKKIGNEILVGGGELPVQDADEFDARLLMHNIREFFRKEGGDARLRQVELEREIDGDEWTPPNHDISFNKSDYENLMKKLENPGYFLKPNDRNRVYNMLGKHLSLRQMKEMMKTKEGRAELAEELSTTKKIIFEGRLPRPTREDLIQLAEKIVDPKEARAAVIDLLKYADLGYDIGVGKEELENATYKEQLEAIRKKLLTKAGVSVKQKSTSPKGSEEKSLEESGSSSATVASTISSILTRNDISQGQIKDYKKTSSRAALNEVAELFYDTETWKVHSAEEMEEAFEKFYDTFKKPVSKTSEVYAVFVRVSYLRTMFNKQKLTEKVLDDVQSYDVDTVERKLAELAREEASAVQF